MARGNSTMASKGKTNNNNSNTNGNTMPAQTAPSVPPTAPIKMGPSRQIAQVLQTKVGVPAPAAGGLQVAAAQRQVLALTPAMLASGQWVKVSTVGAAFKQAGVPISRLVKYFGGDRGFLPTLALPQGITSSSAGTNSHFTALYYGHTRYLPSSALTLGLAQVQAILAGTQQAAFNPAPVVPTVPQA